MSSFATWYQDTPQQITDGIGWGCIYGADGQLCGVMDCKRLTALSIPVYSINDTPLRVLGTFHSVADCEALCDQGLMKRISTEVTQ